MKTRIRRWRSLLLLALLAAAAAVLHLVFSALWLLVTLWLFALGQG
jgi:hypothetical protein